MTHEMSTSLSAFELSRTWKISWSRKARGWFEHFPPPPLEKLEQKMECYHYYYHCHYYFCGCCRRWYLLLVLRVLRPSTSSLLPSETSVFTKYDDYGRKLRVRFYSIKHRSFYQTFSVSDAAFVQGKIWNGKLILTARRWRSKQKNKTKYIYIFKQTAQYFGLKTNLLQGLKEKWK